MDSYFDSTAIAVVAIVCTTIAATILGIVYLNFRDNRVKIEAGMVEVPTVSTQISGTHWERR